MTDADILIGENDAATTVAAGGSETFGKGDAASLRTGVPRFRIIGAASSDSYRVEVWHRLIRDGKTIEQKADEFTSGGGTLDSGSTIFSFISGGPHVGELYLKIHETGGSTSIDIQELGLEYELNL